MNNTEVPPPRRWIDIVQAYEELAEDFPEIGAMVSITKELSRHPLVQSLYPRTSLGRLTMNKSPLQGPPGGQRGELNCIGIDPRRHERWRCWIGGPGFVLQEEYGTPDEVPRIIQDFASILYASPGQY